MARVSTSELIGDTVARAPTIQSSITSGSSGSYLERSGVWKGQGVTGILMYLLSDTLPEIDELLVFGLQHILKLLVLFGLCNPGFHLRRHFSLGRLGLLQLGNHRIQFFLQCHVNALKNGQRIL